MRLKPPVRQTGGMMMENEQKTIIRICLGSSCAARGNTRHLDLLRRYLALHGLDARVELGGGLCAGLCRKGPNLSIDGTVYHGVDEPGLLDILNHVFRKE
jgi:NADH:ubiquinone oxidoreductase subunit E